MPFISVQEGTALAFTSIGNAQTAETNASIAALKLEKEMIQENPGLTQALNSYYTTQAENAKDSENMQAAQMFVSAAVGAATFVAGEYAASKAMEPAEGLGSEEVDEIELQDVNENPAGKEEPPAGDDDGVGGAGKSKKQPSDPVSRKKKLTPQEEQFKNLCEQKALNMRTLWTQTVNSALSNGINGGITFQKSVYDAAQIQAQGNAQVMNGTLSLLGSIVGTLESYKQELGSAASQSTQMYAALINAGSSRG